MRSTHSPNTPRRKPYPTRNQRTPTPTYNLLTNLLQWWLPPYKFMPTAPSLQHNARYPPLRLRASGAQAVVAQLPPGSQLCAGVAADVRSDILFLGSPIKCRQPTNLLQAVCRAQGAIAPTAFARRASKSRSALLCAGEAAGVRFDGSIFPLLR